MGIDLQFVAVTLIAVLAALYAGWRFLRQFIRPDDEAGACARCPAAKEDPFAITTGAGPAPSSASPPADAPRE
jgi:hypothetical protein